MPLGEVVFVSALPATVNTLSAAVGEPVGSGQNDNPFGEQGSEGLAVLATSALRVEVLVAPSDADLVEAGMDVELLNDGFAQDEPVAARLASIGDQVVQSSDGNGRGFPAVIEAIDPIPRAWTGSNVRVDVHRGRDPGRGARRSAAGTFVGSRRRRSGRGARRRRARSRRYRWKRASRLRGSSR